MKRFRVVPIGSKYKIQVRYFFFIWVDFKQRSADGKPYVVEFLSEKSANLYAYFFIIGQ